MGYSLVYGDYNWTSFRTVLTSSTVLHLLYLLSPSFNIHNTSLCFSSFIVSFQKHWLKCITLTPWLFLLKIFISEISQKVQVLLIFSIVILRIRCSSLFQKHTDKNQYSNKTEKFYLDNFGTFYLNWKKEFDFMIDISARFISSFIVI